MRLPVYLDNAATTPMDPRVADKMSEYLTSDGTFGNPASKSHVYGWAAAEAVDIARNQIAHLIGADSREIIFTSGATESDNLATIGVALAHKNLPRKRIVTSMIEHKAILDSCKFLEELGFTVTYIKPNKEGLVTPSMLKEYLGDDVLLVTLMQANNEIGVIQDIGALADVAHSFGALFHSDCAQSAGKVAIDVNSMNVDYLSLSAHKLYGPKGIGAFYARHSSPKPMALIHGGGHERGMRSGTLALHQIVGMGLAYELAEKEMEKDNARILELRNYLMHSLCSLSGVTVNGSMASRLPTNLNLTFHGVNGEQFLLSLKDIAVSTGSACTSASLNPSYVLKAIGLSDGDAHASIRFSLGRFTTKEEIEFAVQHVKTQYMKAKSMGELWS